MDLIGLKFERWLVVEKSKIKNYYWFCVCDCGNEADVYQASLLNGGSKSCGCWSIDYKKERYTTHGLKKHSLYAIWLGIKTRCKNKNSPAYESYGGRGIIICKEWESNFGKFYEDMSPTYEKGLTIERKDVNGNYDKENCIWATRLQQARNRRSNLFIDTLEGNMTLSEAARKAGVSSTAMKYRIKNWPKEQLLISATSKGR